jgi:thiol-disulfide isomerase/thioredoxin
MKKFFIAASFIIGIITGASAQSQYEVLPDRDGSKILMGIISRDLVVKDTSFIKWWDNGLKGYSPNPEAIGALKKYNDSVQIVAFMGTWCEDSHFIIPKFYNLLDAAGFSSDKVSLIGVDRSKKTLGHLSEALNVINVPTIIVMKKGKEIGRIVEYGKYGLIDKELAEILNSSVAPVR